MQDEVPLGLCCFADRRRLVWSRETAACIRPGERGTAVNVIYESWLLLSHSSC